MFSKKSIFAQFILLFAVLTAVAQPKSPVAVGYELVDVRSAGATIRFKAQIDKGWHMYSTEVVDFGPTPCTFTAETLKGCRLEGGLRAVGAPVKKFENMFGTEVYYFENSATFEQRIVFDADNYELGGYLQYGACNDKMCTPPTSVEVSIIGRRPKTPLVADQDEAEKPVETNEEPAVEEQLTADTLTVDTVQTAALPTAPPDDLWQPVVDELAQLESATGGGDLQNGSLWMIFVLGLLGGFVALVTPCVWPIIPMTVSFFLKRSGDRRKGIRDAVIYGLSIVVIYVALGLLVTAIFGASALNSLATNAVFNIFFFLLLVVFAASFFGAFELTLPSSWSNAVDSKAERTGGLLGIFLMAFTLTLVSFSCTGPIIGFLLVEVATDGGNILAPAIGMLGFAVALALPFTLFALFPSWLKSVPRSGGWMNTVKVVLGFVELAFALKFLSVADLAYGWHLLDRETFLALWIVIFALLGLYLLGKIRLPHDDPETHGTVGVVRLLLAMTSLAFAVYMLPGLWGAPLKAVSAFAPPMKTQDFNLMPEAEVHPAFTDYDEGMAYAQQHDKPVMIDFTGYGCVNCRKMEAAVWTNADVARIIQTDYVLIQLYVDEKTALPEPIVVSQGDTQLKLRTVGDKWSWLQSHKFGANAQPFYVLLSPDGHPLIASRAYDEDVDGYLQFLNDGLKAFRNK